MKKVPRGVCWYIGDKPMPGRFVTHVRVPLSRWRWPLPHPMPANWVSRLTWITIYSALAFGALAYVASGWLVLGAGVAVASVPLVGLLGAAVACRRLRREAYSVLRVLKDPGIAIGAEAWLAAAAE